MSWPTSGVDYLQNLQISLLSKKKSFLVSLFTKSPHVVSTILLRAHGAMLPNSSIKNRLGFTVDEIEALVLISIQKLELAKLLWSAKNL